jgi:choline dehydrogenase-like flavoprotein
MAERVDVLIAGSGFGGSITAYRLAELYRAAGSDARSVVVLERGRRYKHTDFKQSMHIGHLSDVYLLIQGQGAQVVVANGVGGGSNLYLAASIRSPRETFERRDRRPGDGPARRIWPGAIPRRTLDP